MLLEHPRRLLDHSSPAHASLQSATNVEQKGGYKSKVDMGVKVLEKTDGKMAKKKRKSTQNRESEKRKKWDEMLANHNAILEAIQETPSMWKSTDMKPLRAFVDFVLQHPRSFPLPPTISRTALVWDVRRHYPNPRGTEYQGHYE